MHLHILGICGTFMGSLALLARELGHQVSGSDTHVYPPMSTQLAAQGIELLEGYSSGHLQPTPDMVIVGNALSRGNPAVEYVLEQGLPYVSGPEWLARNVLQDRWVLAVAGTHGKTTTSSLLAWILEYAGMSPGFLIGGVPQNFGISARLGDTPFFVVEADEYDSAFFDKRSKFVHYRPRTAILNNLEYDHADIFPDLAAIERQFHHLVRTIPSNGLIVHPQGDMALRRVIDMGCWTPRQTTGGEGDWQARLLAADGSRFEVWLGDAPQGVAQWSQTGAHSVANALSALAAARHVGVVPSMGIAALAEFRSAKRRMELLGTVGGVSLYDDFAHHPTAIATTLAGLRAGIGEAPLIAIIEPRSNTMRLGSHAAALAASVASATEVVWFQPPGLDWSLQSVVDASPVPARIETDIDRIIETVLAKASAGTRIVIMSNGGFVDIHQRMLRQLEVTHG
jgi:UDP-N-acetylmuramate: L-alanyl-gamma-D-glutamyl-meso-diaminopimelate ligase